MAPMTQNSAIVAFWSRSGLMSLRISAGSDDHADRAVPASPVGCRQRLFELVISAVVARSNTRNLSDTRPLFTRSRKSG